MPTQVQQRGAVAATQNARTLTARELDVDTTNRRIAVHDGSRAGGWPMANFQDVQNNAFTYAVATGTNTIAISVTPAPTAYAAGQEFVFRAANTTTGAATLNVNSLGARNILRRDTGSGTLIALTSGNIIQNGVYKVVYDGTQFQLVSFDATGLVTVSQGNLNTLTGTFSVNSWNTFSNTGSFGIRVSSVDVTLPGGEYGFVVNPQGESGFAATESLGWITATNTFGSYVSTVRGVAFRTAANISASPVAQGRQRYITSSPPFDLGDGQAQGFVFLLMNADGSVAATYAADVPPWAYNGPTDIKAVKECPITGQKYRRVMKRRTLEQALDNEPITFEYEPITQTIKNADMKLIPHPFGAIQPDQTVVMLDSQDERVGRLLSYMNDGGNIADFYSKMQVKNDKLKRKCPRGVIQVGFEI